MPVDTLPVCMLNDLLAAELNDLNTGTWKAFLREFAPEPESSFDLAEEDAPEILSPEVKAPLHRLETGRWCSLGGYLDYSDWTARERFLELDRAIACDQQHHRERDARPEPQPANTSPCRVVTEEFTACRKSNPQHPVAFLRQTQLSCLVDASSEDQQVFRGRGDGSLRGCQRDTRSMYPAVRHIVILAKWIEQVSALEGETCK